MRMDLFFEIDNDDIIIKMSLKCHYQKLIGAYYGLYYIDGTNYNFRHLLFERIAYKICPSTIVQ